MCVAGALSAAGGPRGGRRPRRCAAEFGRPRFRTFETPWGPLPRTVRGSEIITIVRARSETAMDGPGMKHCRPERSGTVCFTFYMRVRENRSPRSRPGRWPTPVLVGTGTSARTATRGYCTELQLRMESKMECYHVARPRPESPHTS